MTTIISFFFLSLVISLVVTPFAGKLGRWLGALDYPDDRKIHDQVLPRCGGLAIYLGFFLPFLSVLFYRTTVSDLIPWDRTTFGFLAGSALILVVGLWDDISRLRASIKLVLQIGVATIAWWSGFRIEHFVLPYLGGVEFALLSLPVTVLWIVVVINAINLIDGLDGLAAGIALFASIVLAVVSLLGNNLLGALMFASLSGALLGFLRYNFNPASIFLGDSGTYFIGFTLATLGLGTSQKSSLVVAILIPMVAPGIPLMDMMLAAVRRFVYGINIFTPDREHIHHRLLRLGYTPRRAVLLFYGITVVLGCICLLMVNIRDERVGLILGALAIVSIFAIRKLGYLEYFTGDKLLGWLADVTDEVGIRRDRRTFLSMQVAIAESENIHQFWGRTIYVAEKINLSAIYLELHPEAFCGCGSCSLPRFIWENGPPWEAREKENGCSLLVELPLVSKGKYYATLNLKKSVNKGDDDRLVLRRIEHLRRSTTSALEKLAERSFPCPEVLEDRRREDNHTDREAGDLPVTAEWDGYERRKFGNSGMPPPLSRR